MASEPPRIALLSAEYPPRIGGVGDYTYHLANALGALTATAVFTDSGGPGHGPEVRDIATNWGRRLRGQVQQALTDWGADILHIQYQTGAYGMKPAVNLLPSRVDVPVVVTLHDLRMPYLAPKVAPLRRYVTRLLIESADRVIVTNAEDRDRLLGQAKASDDPEIFSLARPLEPEPSVIPIGANIDVCPVDRAAIRDELGVGADVALVAYFGMLNASKGVHTLIEAMEQLPEARLLIIGGATSTSADEEYAARIEAQIAERGLSERIIRPGYVPAERVSALLQSADVVALPFVDGASYRRGSLLAALAHGAPVVTTAPPGKLEPPLRDSIQCVLVAPEDPAALARAIERIRNDQSLAERLRNNGPRLAERFNWCSIAKSHLAIYEELCSKR